MPVYEYTENKTGETVRFEWNGKAPPTAADFDAVMAQKRAAGTAKPTIKDGDTTMENGEPDLRWYEGGIGQTFTRELNDATNNLVESFKKPIVGDSALETVGNFIGNSLQGGLGIMQGAFSPVTALSENLVGQPVKEGLKGVGVADMPSEFIGNMAQYASEMISPGALIRNRLLPQALAITKSIPHKFGTDPVKDVLKPLSKDISDLPAADRAAVAHQKLKRPEEPGYESIVQPKPAAQPIVGEQGVQAGGVAYGQELPKYAGGDTGINLAARAGEDQDLMHMINLLTERNKATMTKAKGGIKAWHETKKGGEELLETLGEKKDVIVQRVGMKTDDIDDWMYAANQVLKNEGDKLKSMIVQAVDSGDPAQMEQLKPYLQQFVQVMADVGGAGSKLGRALNAQKIISQTKAGYTGIIDAIQNANLHPDLLKGMAEMKPHELGKFLRNMTHPKFWDYFKSFWYNSILSGIPTHIVNTTSNIAWQTAQVPYKAMRGAADMVVSGLTGKTRDFYIREAIPNLTAMRAGLRSGTAKGLQALKHGIVLGDTSKLDIAHIAPWAFSPHPWMRKVAPVVELPSRLLQMSDSFFKGIAYEAERHALATRYAMKEGRKGADRAKRIIELLDDEFIMEHADNYAKYVTFTDEPGAFTKKLLALREGTNVGKALTFVTPFISTPANIMKRGLEMVPGLGALPDTFRAFNGTLSKAQAIETLTKQAIGAGIGSYFAQKYADGELTGAMPTDPNEIDEWTRAKKIPWAVKFNGEWYEYRRWEPFNTVISSVATLADRLKVNPDDWGIDDVLSATSGIAKNFLNVSYMSQLASLVEAIEDPKSEKINDFLAQFGSSFVPFSSMLRTVGKMTDLVQLEDGTVGSPKKDPKGFVEGVKSQLPYFRKSVPNKLDYFGEPKITEGDAIRQFLPFKWTKENQDVMEKELQKSETKVGRMDDKIDGKKLTREQYYILRQTTGHMLKENLRNLMDTEGYKNASQEDKDEMIKEEMKATRSEGRDKMRAQLQQQAMNTVTDRMPKDPDPTVETAKFDVGNMLFAGGTAVAGVLGHKPGMVKQAIKSAMTSVSKVPRSFKHGVFNPGTINVDIGGGRFEVGTEFLKNKKGVTNLVIDPFNRPPEHNASVRAVLANQKADSATVNDVLNVIREPIHREGVIKDAASVIKPDGFAYFQVHPGDESGIGKVTKVNKKTGEELNWQNNKPVNDYVDEVRQWFDEVFLYQHGSGKNDMIIVAKSPRETKNLFKTFEKGVEIVKAEGRARKPKYDYWADNIKAGKFGSETANFVKNLRKMQGEEGTALHLNSKTKISIDFDTLCPMRESGIGSCPYCYVEHGRLSDRLFNMKGSAKGEYSNTPYRGEIKHMPQEMIDDLNSDGGIRMFSFSDYRDKHYEQVAQLLSDAHDRGLMVKAITKQKNFVDTFGDFPSLRINISTDMLPRHMSNAPTVEDALLWKAGRDNIKIRAVAMNKEQAIRAGNDPNVSVVTLYHGLDNNKGQLMQIIEEQNPGLIAKVGRQAVLDEINTWVNFRHDYDRFKELQKMFPNKICCQGGKCSRDKTKCGFAPVGLGALIPGVWIPMLNEKKVE